MNINIGFVLLMVLFFVVIIFILVISMKKPREEKYLKIDELQEESYRVIDEFKEVAENYLDRLEKKIEELDKKIASMKEKEETIDEKTKLEKKLLTRGNEFKDLSKKPMEERQTEIRRLLDMGYEEKEIVRVLNVMPGLVEVVSNVRKLEKNV